MRPWYKRPYDIIRIAFGLVWAIDAAFKWTPTFLNGLPDMLSSMVQGQPAFVAAWLNLWIGATGAAPHFFAVLIALAESAIAIGLIFDILPRITLVSGFIYSLVAVWGVGEAFGGAYSSASTDIGTGIIYAFVFAALWFWKRGKPSGHADKGHADKTEGSAPVKLMSVVIVILLAILVAPYFITKTSTAEQTDMPPGMVMKMYELASTTAPIPTVSFIVKKDALDGWDLHVMTTDFTWTPELINQAPVAGEGHAHLYIDGVLTVLLAPWYHIDGSVLLPGKHTITVSLNANDHSVFSVNGQPIQSMQTLIVSPI